MRMFGKLTAVLLTFAAAFATQARTTAFVGVNVSPMDRERVIANHAVVARCPSTLRGGN